MKYFLIAGEASGDLHAGRLIDALRREDGEASFCYLGGDCMQAASGVAPVVHYRAMAYMAFSEVLRHLPDIFKNMRIAKESIARFAPRCNRAGRLSVVQFEDCQICMAQREFLCITTFRRKSGRGKRGA